MLGLLTSSMPVLPAASSQKSCWGFWVDHILKQKQLGFRKAALLNASTGAVVASSGFSLSDKDVAVGVLEIQIYYGSDIIGENFFFVSEWKVFVRSFCDLITLCNCAIKVHTIHRLGKKKSVIFRNRCFSGKT